MRDVKDGVLRRGRDGGDVTLGAAAGLALLQNKAGGRNPNDFNGNPGGLVAREAALRLALRAKCGIRVRV